MESIVKRWYSEYTNASYVTKEELAELLELLHIINQRIGTIGEIDGDAIGEGLAALVRPPPNTIESARLDSFRSRQLTGEQGSAQWLRERHMYITASISAACAGLMGPSARENQILEKASFGAYSPFKGGYYTQKGNLFEDVTAGYYSYINGKKIWPFGLIPHQDPKYGFLAASTDGVTDDLINIEIKTLVGRQPDRTTVKKEYYHQMQQQMACLGLDQTDFIEVKYKELTALPKENEANIAGRVGVILEWWIIPQGTFEYVYSPMGLSPADLVTWEKQHLEQSGPSQVPAQGIYIRSIYWKMTDYLCRRIPRDPKWINTMGPKLKAFWDEVLKLRVNSQELSQRIQNKDVRGEPSFDTCML